MATTGLRIKEAAPAGLLTFAVAVLLDTTPRLTMFHNVCRSIRGLLILNGQTSHCGRLNMTISISRLVTSQ